MSAQFIHEPYNFPDLKEETFRTGSRNYVTPEGNKYPSVTTILSAMSDKSHLDAWKARIGEEAAAKKTKYATERGKKVHTIFEDFVNNCFDASKYEPHTMLMFNKSRKYLEKNLTKVYNLEFCVYSDILKTAGRCDLLCEWNGVPTILDYKTSEKYKKEEWIRNYFLQETTYSMCLFEKHKIVVPQILTFIVTEEENEPQIFLRNTKDYMKETLTLFRNYHQNNG